MSGFVFLESLKQVFVVAVTWVILSPIFNYFYEFGQLNGINPILLKACYISWWYAPLIFIAGTWIWYFLQVQRNEQTSRPI